MKLPNSKIGLALSVLYLAVSLYLIATQGLFGESFVALFLGYPWSFLIILLKLHELIPDTHVLFPLFLYVWLLVPIGVNGFLLYRFGVMIQRSMKRSWDD